MSGINYTEGDLKNGFSPLNVILPIHDAENSFVPFLHAVKLAYASHGELEIVDVRSEKESIEHLGVRNLLEQWGVLSLNSKRSDVLDCGLKIKKIIREGNKKKEILKRLVRHSHDLLVIGTKHRNGFGSFGRDLGEYLADYYRHTTLLIPFGAKPFVNENNGTVSLKTILIPLKSTKFLPFIIRYVNLLVSVFPEIDPVVIALHSGSSFPEMGEDFRKLQWKQECRDQSLIEAILTSVEQNNADLIIMATDGKESFTEFFTGTSTEQVLHKCNCPVLSITTHTH